MQRTRIIETEVAIGSSSGLATSISNATCLRIHNYNSGVSTVAISTSVGAATSQYFSIPGNSVEFLEKNPTDVIWASPTVKAAKVAFTN
jgi:hypothetical protein